MNNGHEITGCEVCGNTQLSSVLNLGAHPMCDDLVAVGDNRVCREYPIEIMYCDVCRTAHQRYQVPKQDLFPKDYHYRSRFTVDVLRGMEGLVQSVEQGYGPIKGMRVVDVGCNDGSLLDFFAAKGAETIGVEPTGASQDAKGRSHAIYNEFLTASVAETIVRERGHADIITFTNVFAHIEDLRGLIASLKTLMTPKTLFVIENHYLGAVLDGAQFDTFYHEHPRTYSLTSFEYIARSLGATLVKAEFPARYGGNIRVFMRASDAPMDSVDATLTEAKRREPAFRQKFDQMAADISIWGDHKKQVIDQLVKKHGPLYAKAFPGRAAILVKLLGLNEKQIAGVFEKPGSMKIGHYLPGTRIPIRSDDELFAMPQPPVLINLAWHISSEIRGYLAANGCKSEIIDIIQPEDIRQAA